MLLTGMWLPQNSIQLLGDGIVIRTISYGNPKILVVPIRVYTHWVSILNGYQNLKEKRY